MGNEASLRFHMFHRNDSVYQRFAVKPYMQNIFSYGYEGRKVASSFLVRSDVSDGGLRNNRIDYTPKNR